MAMTLAHAEPPATDDPWLWLEDVEGTKALDWVRAQNAVSQPQIESRPEFKAIHERILAIFNSRSRIPYVQKRGKWLYNFWQDEKAPRGVWRRTTLEEYRKPQPAWETLVDLDKLSAEENEKWVWKGATCLYPEYRRCLIELSRGGADAFEVREFDTVAKRWVKGGFRSPESKHEIEWRDADTVYIGRDFGPGSMTNSGYPRIVKEWKRGTPLAAAKTLFEGVVTDVGVGVVVVNEPGRKYELIHRAVTFYEGEDYLREGEHWIRLQTPADAQVGTANGWLFVKLRTDWKPAATTFKGGSLIAANLDAFLSGGRDFETIFEPAGRVALQGYDVTRHKLLLDLLDNVKSRIVEVRFPPSALKEGRGEGKWVRTEVPVPPSSSVGVAAFDRDHSDDYWMTVTSFVEPTTLYLAQPGGARREKLKSLPAFFDSKGLEVSQHEAASKDGTKIPYFVVMRAGAKADGSTPTILYGYGGFEIPMTPGYSGAIGAGWLERGGVYVLANLRGGGEFGPEWHRAAQREGHQRSFDDFIAVAEDLDRAAHHLARAPRHHGRQQRRAAGGRDLHPASRPLQGGGVPGAAAGHEALQPPPRGRFLDRRVRQPGRSGGLGVHLEVLAVPEREEGREVPARALHHHHARRPRAPRPRAQDGREDGGAGPRRAVLREHRGRPRRGLHAGAAGLHVGHHLHVPAGRIEVIPVGYNSASPERCPRGRRGRPAKALYGLKPVSRVRILSLRFFFVFFVCLFSRSRSLCGSCCSLLRGLARRAFLFVGSFSRLSLCIF